MIDLARTEGNSLLLEVMRGTPKGERLLHCIQCGSCGGSCPNGPDMDYSPRALFALIQAGEREKVLSANTMWVCVSCYACTTRCPQQIPITEILYTLKRISLREGLAKGTDGPALARTFVHYLHNYGRSFEFGLATRFYLFNKPFAMMKMGPLGLKMLSHGRMTLLPTRIKNVKQLEAIIQKARELGD